MKNKLGKLLQKLKKPKSVNFDKKDSKIVDESVTQPKVILIEQLIRFLGIILIILIVIILVVTISSKINSKTKSDKQTEEEIQQNNKILPIELANNALDPEKMWRNHFEDKLSESNKKLDNKLGDIANSFAKKEQDLERTAKEQLAYMQEQLNSAREELLEAVGELKLAREANNNRGVENFMEDFGNLRIHKIDNENGIIGPKNSRYFIPETAYVNGVLLGGISVSTSVGA